MNVNEKIKKNREAAGLTVAEAAKLIPLSWNEYFDVELHPDEIFSAVALSKLKKICEIFKVDFLDLFDLKCSFCEENKEFLADYSLPRNELIRKRRMEMGISQEELGDRVGFYGVEVQNLENTPDHIETWVLENIKELATAINVPLQLLLGVKCNKCGR